MNPLQEDWVGSLIRHAITYAAGYLVAQDYITASGATAIVGIVWAGYQKFAARRKLVTSLAMPPTTEAVVEKTIAQGRQAEVTTPKTDRPTIEAKP
jgi:hypothetical protein